jgi:hypothetical protein
VIREKHNISDETDATPTENPTEDAETDSESETESKSEDEEPPVVVEKKEPVKQPKVKKDNEPKPTVKPGKSNNEIVQKFHNNTQMITCKSQTSFA